MCCCYVTHTTKGWVVSRKQDFSQSNSKEPFWIHFRHRKNWRIVCTQVFRNYWNIICLKLPFLTLCKLKLRGISKVTYFPLISLFCWEFPVILGFGDTRETRSADMTKVRKFQQSGSYNNHEVSTLGKLQQSESFNTQEVTTIRKF